MENNRTARNSLYLKNRIRINNKFSANNLNDWIFSLFKLKDDSAILDICCGRGNQTFRFSETCPKGIVYALDISKDSLVDIEKKNIQNIKIIEMDIDTIDNILFKDSYFDCVHCSYGLYYAKKPEKIIQKIYSLIKPGGFFIIVGPVGDNNLELFNLIETLYPIDKDIIFSSRDFMNKVVLVEFNKLFKKIEKNYFTNKIFYPNANELLFYLQSSTMYKQEYSNELINIINDYFKNNASFVIGKRAMAIVGRK